MKKIILIGLLTFSVIISYSQAILPTSWSFTTVNLPNGWTLSGDDIIVVAPGEIKGIPLQIQPSQSWNENNILIDIELEHPILGTIIHPITINNSDTVLISSPVHTGRSGEKVSVTTDSLTSGIETSMIPLPNDRSNTTHNGMSLHLVGIPSPIHSADCNNKCPRFPCRYGRVTVGLGLLS